MISVRVVGLENLERKLRVAPNILDREVGKALGDSIAMVETESARRTPVDTGLLRSSIGGAKGWKWVRGWRASVGTNVEYAVYVHEGHARHNIGERKFMTKGAKASRDFISKRFKRAMHNLARHISN